MSSVFTNWRDGTNRPGDITDPPLWWLITEVASEAVNFPEQVLFEGETSSVIFSAAASGKPGLLYDQTGVYQTTSQRGGKQMCQDILNLRVGSLQQEERVYLYILSVFYQKPGLSSIWLPGLLKKSWETVRCGEKQRQRDKWHFIARVQHLAM